MSIWIVADPARTLSRATKACIEAAKTLPGEVVLWLIGSQLHDLTEEACALEGVSLVRVVDHPSLRDLVAEQVVDVLDASKDRPNYLFMPSSTFGKNILPRLGARWDVNPLTDVISVLSERTFVRPIYAGNALSVVEVLDTPVMATIRSTAFSGDLSASTNKAQVEQLTYSLPMPKQVAFESYQRTERVRPELTSARVVVSGGRALQSAENFKLIEQLADKLGGAVGASRAAVDAGYIANDHQVGQTGKVVAPELYIAVGISGAIQHVAGMKDSKIIVAINSDPEAPIMQMADYALVGDLFELVPQLIQQLGESQ